MVQQDKGVAMQTNLINGGDLAAHALLYGPPSNTLLNYVNHGIDTAMDILGTGSQRFIDASKALYNKFNSSQVINAAKSLVYNLGGHRSELVLQCIREEENFNPNLLMQRYIMANPVVGEKHRRNMCAGYPETYFDMEPGVYGKDRAEYRQVMDGILTHDKDGEGFINHYSDGTELEELPEIDKFAILRTWDTVANLIACGKDPTDLE